MSDGMSDSRVRGSEKGKLVITPGVELDIEHISTGWGDSVQVVEACPWWDWAEADERLLREAIQRDIERARHVLDFLKNRSRKPESSPSDDEIP